MSEIRQDERIKTKMFSWKNYVSTYVTVLLFSTGQTVVLALYYGNPSRVPVGLAIGLEIYCAVLALMFCLLTKHYIILAYDEPIKRLGEAARRVTEGDFSIYVPPEHSANEANCMDVLTQDFNTMVATLGSSEVFKSDFIANVSHEIRTPVAVIENSAELLKKDKNLTEEQQRHLAAIRQSTKALVSLTKKLLTLNQLETHTLSVDMQECNLYDQLCENLLRFEEELDEKQIELEMAVDEDVEIRANPGLLGIIWSNLFSNAIKFSPMGGKVTLRSSIDDSGVNVSIMDEGCGMSRETMTHAFDKFYQGDTSHSSEGNGLGLALAKAAAQLAHSTISIRSTLGGGSEFIVHLAQ